MTYTRSITHKPSFTANVFSLFTAECGGSAAELCDILHGKYTVDDFAYHDDMIYFGIVEYFRKTVIPHKIAIYNAGIELSNQPWFSDYLKGDQKDLFIENLWVHDLSKFSADEAFGYSMYNRNTDQGREAFEQAWHHHKMHNPHHPEYWMNPNRSGHVEPFPMPVLYAMEMIADWIGAGKTYGNTLEQWLPDNLHRFRFGASKSIVKNILECLGINTVIDEGNTLIIP